MKLSTIINSESSLKKLLAVSLPVKVAYKLSKIVQLIQPELTIFTEQRDKLIREFGKETKEGTFQVEPENIQKFSDEIGKLTDIEVKLDFGAGKTLEPIKLEELGEINLEAQDLFNLSWLIVD